MKTEIYSIIYSPEQIPEYIPYDNSHVKSVNQKSYLFEYNPIIEIIDNKLDTDLTDEDYLGILSWKFSVKTGIFKKKLYWILDNNPNFDIYVFCKNTKELKGNYLAFSERVHPGFLKLFTLICKDLGLKVQEPEIIIYSNFFIMKTKIYKDFVNTIIKPAIQLLETKYKDLAWQNANYNSSLTKNQLKELSELEYYPMFPFILERLISIYLLNNHYKCFILS